MQVLPRPTTVDDSLIITPTPNFVIKSLCVGLSGLAAESKKVSSDQIVDADLYVPRTFSIGHKVYINLCSHSAMPPVRRTIAEGSKNTEEAAVNVPLAVGPVKHDIDKAGEPCCVVDMVMHPDVAQDCEKDPTGAFRHWLVQLASQYMDKKHGLILSPQYRLPKLLYKGDTVTQQRIRKPAGGAGIREVLSSSSLESTTKKNDPISSNVKVVPPMAILSEAGALPFDTSISNSATSTSSSKNTNNKSRMTGGSGVIPMDIRLVNSNKEDGINSDVLEEKRANEEHLQRLGLDSGGSIISPSSSSIPTSSFGLTAIATKRAPISPLVSVTISISTQSDGENSNMTAISCECIPEPTQSTRTETLGKGTKQSDKSDNDYLLRASLPTTLSLSSGISIVSVSITFPERPSSKHSEVSEPLLSTSLSTEITSAGDILYISATDYRRVVLKLPVTCQTVGLNSTSTFDEGFRILSTKLPVQFGKSFLPPLPSSLSNIDSNSLRVLLERYVEADINISSPDPGSKPWLVAQALASDEVGESKAETDAKKQTEEANNSSNSDDTRLPEDAFLEADALSTHFLRQREEDRKRQAEKEALKEKERLESGLPESTLLDLVQKVDRPKVSEVTPIVDSSLLTDLL